MLTTLDQQLVDLSAKLDRRDELAFKEIDLYSRIAEGNAELTELDAALASLTADLEELERNSFSKVVIGLVSNKRTKAIQSKRDKQTEVQYGRDDCDRKLESTRREFRSVQSALDALDGIDEEFAPVAQQREAELNELDPALAERIAHLADAVNVNKHNVLILDEAVQCGAEALGTAKALADSLIETGNAQVRVRTRTLAGLALVAVAGAKNRAVKGKNIEPIQAMRDRLERLIKKVSSIPWDTETQTASERDACLDDAAELEGCPSPNAMVDPRPTGQSSPVTALLATLTRMHSVMDDEFAREATGRPEVAAQITAHIEPLLFHLLDRKKQEQASMRTYGREQRKLLETAPVPQVI